jgi:hypothetical protein
MFPHLLYFWKKPLIIPKLALLSAANFYDPRINPLERSETDRALQSHKSAEKGRVLSRLHRNSQEIGDFLQSRGALGRSATRAGQSFEFRISSQSSFFLYPKTSIM